eukprot:1151518-Pyramimonas_sp.AAC.1
MQWTSGPLACTRRRRGSCSGRWVWWAVCLGQGIEARGGEGLPPAAERSQARLADGERSQAAEEARGEG